MGTTSLVTAILSVIIISIAHQTTANSSVMGGTDDCYQKIFHRVVVKEDSMGRKCSDLVAMRGCQGRCLTYVVGDWKFPFKKYFHQVCIHGRRIESEWILRNCDEGVTPGTERYVFIEAGECSCSICNSSETSCEGAHKRGPPSPPAQDTDDISNDVLVPVEATEVKWSYHSPPPHVPAFNP